MRALSIFLAAAALLTTVGTAQAETGSTHMQRVNAEQMEQIAGSYRLSNGQRADIFLLGTQLYVKLGGQRKQLILTGPNRLASRDGTISIQFGTDFDSDCIVLQHGGTIGMQDTIRLAANDRPGRGGTD